MKIASTILLLVLMMIVGKCISKQETKGGYWALLYLVYGIIALLVLGFGIYKLIEII